MSTEMSYKLDLRGGNPRVVSGPRGSPTVTSGHDLLEADLSALPIGHTTRQKAVKGRSVGALTQMTELMDDDVVDAVNRGFHEFGIQ